VQAFQEHLLSSNSTLVSNDTMHGVDVFTPLLPENVPEIDADLVNEFAGKYGWAGDARSFPLPYIHIFKWSSVDLLL